MKAHLCYILLNCQSLLKKNLRVAYFDKNVTQCFESLRFMKYLATSN